jgi:hypothetical protein
MPKHSIVLTTSLAAAYAADAGPAHAYIDPATGSILVQGLVGGLATFMVVLRLYGAKAKRGILALLWRAPVAADQNTHTAE